MDDVARHALTQRRRDGKAGMPLPASMTHLQVLAVVATELKASRPTPDGQPVRILDIGCGDGRLIVYLETALPYLFPGALFEVHGFDVADHGVQTAGYFSQTIARLEAELPGIDWGRRLHLLSERDSWPYTSGSLDVVVSNQVMEHVDDHDRFYAEMARVLAVDGFGVHVFPSRHCLIEPHLHIPLVHRLRSATAIRNTIQLFSRLRIGLYRTFASMHPGVTPASFATSHTDFYVRFTNYKCEHELHDLAKRYRLHSTFNYSWFYYRAKLAHVLGRPPMYDLSVAERTTSGILSFFCRYIANTTLVVNKRACYSTNRNGSPSQARRPDILDIAAGKR